MSYPATLTLSVDAAHERFISLWDTAAAARFCGMEGGVPSTVTVACAVELPSALVAVRVYIAVDAGETMTEPVEVAASFPIP
jgi:hypothetical protein